MPVTFTPVSSPVGELVLAATDSGITGVYFPTSRHGPAPLERQDWVEDDGRSPASALLAQARDRKSTRLNSSHGYISYAVFCLKKKTHQPCWSGASTTRPAFRASRDLICRA